MPKLSFTQEPLRGPVTVPVMSLREVVIFPHTVAPLLVGREGSIKAVESAFRSPAPDKPIFLVLQKDATQESVSGPEQLYSMGVVCRVLQTLRLPDGTVKALFEGLYRATFANYANDDPFPTATVTEVPQEMGDETSFDAAASLLSEELQSFLKSGRKINQETVTALTAIKDAGTLADSIMSRVNVPYQRKQEVLEITNVARRLEEVFVCLHGENSIADVETRIKNRVRDAMEKSQRDYYLTEQIKAINKELGREEDPLQELDDVLKALEARDMPEEAKEKVRSEIHKLRIMTPSAAEYTILRSYVDWVMDLPWNKLKEIGIDIADARRILDANHYGLEKPKERILEYLAVQKLSGGLKGPILCFVGPPGVGKTSLAKSVAKATGREYVRLSLGGVRDEAEIRGHRRTYIGALPGKIIQSLKRVDHNNPLFCLDEIDKMTSDFRGDPAAAMLEVLDPEQNCTFMDHYLDLDYDLSKIFFITTANSVDGIPAPLLDRMEIIELNSYLETEKFHIAKSFLIPRQIEENGLQPEDISFTDSALTAIIREYTSESGVRTLERRIAKICRKAAIKLLESGAKTDAKAAAKAAPEAAEAGQTAEAAGIPEQEAQAAPEAKGKAATAPFIVDVKSLPDLLGVPVYRHDRPEQASTVGVCNGLAWTSAGGELLLVETSIMPGTGTIAATGKLGEVMQESAKAALTYVRSHSAELGLAADFYKQVDIHVHVPDGATPKDGPSAGITIVTAITSALLGIPVRSDVAMTGEISLRGRVLPIGGLQEKLLGAKRAGVSTILIPKDNVRNLKEVPAEVLKDLDIVPVEHASEVLLKALDATEAEIFSGGDSLPLAKTLRADFPRPAQPAVTSSAPQ
ncbi:MAG: endopeptidase La [Desulfovibrio sp.]|nr:endopeptidase La [Desulfovibrio sp.]